MSEKYFYETLEYEDASPEMHIVVLCTFADPSDSTGNTKRTVTATKAFAYDFKMRNSVSVGFDKREAKPGQVIGLEINSTGFEVINPLNGRDVNRTGIP